MKTFLTKLCSDDAGNVSSVRVCLVAFSLTLTGAWAFVSVKSGTLSDIPSGVQTLFAAMMGGKLIQKQQEAKATVLAS